MKIKDKETFEEWSERVRQFEFGYAMQALANGTDHDTVLEQMSIRISNKLKHYIFTCIKVPYRYDMNKHKLEYEQIMKMISPVADHVIWE
jgi:glutamyl-tRNA reductase